jgi:hypothetical protein
MAVEQLVAGTTFLFLAQSTVQNALAKSTNGSTNDSNRCIVDLNTHICSRAQQTCKTACLAEFSPLNIED